MALMTSIAVSDIRYVNEKYMWSIIAEMSLRVEDGVTPILICCSKFLPKATRLARQHPRHQAASLDTGLHREPIQISYRSLNLGLVQYRLDATEQLGAGLVVCGLNAVLVKEGEHLSLAPVLWIYGRFR